MKLSTRLTLFFLGPLAIVLLGFSFALHAMVSKYLHRQVDDRLEAVLNTLEAAAEFGPEGLEWEPRERYLPFSIGAPEAAFVWQVRDEKGQRLDGTSSGEVERLLTDVSSDLTEQFSTVKDAHGTLWRTRQRYLLPRPQPPEDVSPNEEPPAPGSGHDALTLSAAVSLEPVRGELRTLALMLTGLALSVWALALLCGRWLSRRALRPVTDMAEAARAIGGHEIDQRLPVAPTNDELEELGRSFDALLDRLQESFERQRRFTGDASHQLRTPLTALQGQVDLALRQDRDASEYQRILEIVQRKTRHLRQIIDSLLFLARADHEALAPKLEAIDLAAWLEAHARFWTDLSRNSDLRLEIRDPAPHWARVQPGLLSELVNNLLDNALRYSDPGTPVRVALTREEAMICLAIADEGIGISEQELPHLFEPFHRSAEARRRSASGVGLGLAVARRLAESFGGTITVESQFGAGSRFTILFPPDSSPERVRHQAAEEASQSRED